MSGEAYPARRNRALGCIKWAAIVIGALTALGLAIGFLFDQGDNANQPQRGVNAGAAAQYAPASVTYLEDDHAYVVRLQDGEFIALYDLSPKQQAAGNDDCRVFYDEQAVLPEKPQLPGFTGALVEECESTRTSWRVDGEFAAGAGFGNLDRFNTQMNDAGDLIVRTDSRTCTRSGGVAGIPPFYETRCTGKPP